MKKRALQNAKLKPVRCLGHDSSKWVSKSGTNSQSISQEFGIHALVILVNLRILERE